MILKSAQIAAEEKVEAWRKSAEIESDKTFQSLARGIEEDLSRKLIQMQGTANKVVLEKKNRILQQIFAQAKESILSLPREEHIKIMKKLLEKSAGESGGALRIHPEDKDLFETLLEDFNSDRSENSQITLLNDQPLPDRGGFIYVADRFQVDQSLETLLNDIQYELAPEISAALFSEEACK